MADGALLATEEQFGSLLLAAAPADVDLTLRYFSLRELERGEVARTHMAGRYEDQKALFTHGVDALVATGAEPRTANLEAEAYWPSLARVIDWSEANAIPTAWSCLAAHAAAWRLAGVERKRLSTKASGVFSLELTAGHRLLQDAPSDVAAPHSRLNDLSAREIEAAGFEILARSPDVGVDTFARSGSSFSLYFQGHPEYDAGALGREYLRDVSRFLRGQQDHHPSAPSGYFDPVALEIVKDLALESTRTRDPNLINDYARAVHDRIPTATWRPWALHVYHAWLAQLIDATDRATNVDLPQTP
jgi:homoserine O-succinyltransferase